MHKPSKKHLCLHEKQLANRKEVKYFGKKVRRPQTLANTGLEGHQKQKYSHFDLKISILRAKSPSTSGKKIRGQKMGKHRIYKGNWYLCKSEVDGLFRWKSVDFEVRLGYYDGDS